MIQFQFYQTREHHFNVSRAKKSFCLLSGGAHPPTTYTQKTNRPLHHSNKPNQNCPSLKIGRNTNIKRITSVTSKQKSKARSFAGWSWAEFYRLGFAPSFRHLELWNHHLPPARYRRPSLGGWGGTHRGFCDMGSWESSQHLGLQNMEKRAKGVEV